MFENKKNKHLFPTLDLHGETQKMATTLVNDFINDNLLLNNKYIVIVHGLGSGVLKETAYEVIKKNPNVLAYYVDPYNKGCTIVELTKNHNMNEAKEEKIEKVTKKNRWITECN